MNLLRNLPRSFTSRCVNKITVPIYNSKDFCEYCKGSGIFRCISCKGRGITIEDGKEYRCSMCNRTGWKICNFCDGDGYSYRIF